MSVYDPVYQAAYRERNREKKRAYNKVYNKEWIKRPEVKERYLIKNREKAHLFPAWIPIRRRIARKKMVRPACIYCGNPKTVAHHEDYSKPFDVVWACHIHHAAIHAGKLKVKKKDISHVKP